MFSFLQKAPGRKFILLAVSLLLLLDIGIRLIRYSQLEYQSRDSIGYILLVEKWMQSEEKMLPRNDSTAWIVDKPPLLYWVLAFGEKLGIGAERFGLSFVFLCGVCLPFVLGGLAHELFLDWRYTLGTIYLASVMPPLVRYSVLILRDMPYWLFFACAVWSAVRAERKHNLLYWCVFAFFTSLAVLTRREGIELLLAWGIWLVCCNWSKGHIRNNIIHKAMNVGIVLGLLFAILIPIQIFWTNKGSSWQFLPFQTILYYFHRPFF